MAKRTNRTACGLAAILAMVVLGGLGLLGMRLRWIWVARYHGEGGHLDGAILAGVDFKGANLKRAGLKRANLRDTDLSRAALWSADLSGADIRHANLSGADRSQLQRASLTGAQMEGATLDSAEPRPKVLQFRWQAYRSAVATRRSWTEATQPEGQH